MKLDLTGTGVLAIVAAVGVGWLGWRAWRALPGAAAAVRDAGGAVLDAVNPASPTNLVNRGVEAVGQAATGNPAWSLGGALWELTSGAQFQREYDAAITAPQASYDETARLLARYPAPPPDPGIDYSNAFPGYGVAP